VHSWIPASCERRPGIASAGASIDEILIDYSFLEPEDILAAIEYAAYQVDHPVLQVS
jgi:uncharacterized protein (DUF433 family)